MIAAPRTAICYSRQLFPRNIIPPGRTDSVTSRLIQAYPSPVLPGLANNRFTNPVLVQDYN